MSLLRSLFASMFPVTSSRALSPRCSVCSHIAAEVEVYEASPGEWYFKYSGLGGSNGNGDRISAQRAKEIQEAFTEKPYTSEKIRKAELYDDAGFCGACAKFYCFKHWNVSNGGGRCPKGHFKSLDPHWSPDD